METRESRLAYYLNELSTKFVAEPNKEEILLFFGAIDSGAAAASASDRPSTPTPTPNKKGEEGALSSSPSFIHSSSSQPHTETLAVAKEEATITLQDQQAYARLLPVLTNGITVIKHGRRGAPKKRLIFCNEDCSQIYWASDHRSSKRVTNLSSLKVEDIIEVREGTAPDPEHPGQVGTATLRRRRSSLAVVMGKRGGAGGRQQHQQAFSLISPARSLDLEAPTPAEFKLLFEGLRATVLIKKEAARAAAAAAVAALEAQKAVSPRGGGVGSMKRTVALAPPPPAAIA